MKGILKKTILMVILQSTLLLTLSYAQIAINETNVAPDSAAILDISSTDKGVLLPRMTEAERDAIANPIQGLLIYNTEDDCFNYYTGTNWVKDCGRSLTTDSEATTAASGGGTGFDRGNAITTDSEGNVIVGGYISGDATFGEDTYENQGGQDAIVLKYSATGELLWSLHFASSGNENAYTVETDANDNIYVGGNTDGNLTIGTETISETGSFFYIAKFDADGVFQSLWYEANTNTYIEDMVVAADGSIHAIGGFTTTTTFGSMTLTTDGSNETFLLKLDANSNVVWVSQSSSDYTYAYNMNIDVNGNIHITGEFEGTATFGNTTLSTSDGNYLAFWATFASDGSFVRAVQAEGTDSYGYGVGSDAAGNIYLTVFFSDDFTLDNTTISTTTSGAYVAKYNSDGVLVWLKQLTSSSSSFGWRIQGKDNGEIVLMGGFRSDMTFDNVTYTNAENSQSLLVLAFDGDGNTTWIYHTSGNGTVNGYDLTFDTDGNSYIVGNFNSTETIGGQPLTSLGSRDIFYTQLSNEGNPFQYTNDIDSSQDGDTDATNELQDISFSGTNLSLSNGSTVDLSSIDTDTDNQTIDQLSLNGSILQISLEDDGAATLELDLSVIDTNTDTDTDNQTIDQFSLNGSILQLSLEDDEEATLELDLSTIDTDTDTDNQTIDQLSLNGKTLQISLEDDGENTQELDLSSIDNQTIDGFELDGTTLKISLENDGAAALEVDLASIDTDTDTQLSESEVLTIINNNGFITDPDDADADPTNEIELPSGGTDGQLLKTDGEGNYSWVDDADGQTIDNFTLADDVLSISLENDGVDALNVDYKLDSYGNYPYKN